MLFKVVWIGLLTLVFVSLWHSTTPIPLLQSFCWNTIANRRNNKAVDIETGKDDMSSKLETILQHAEIRQLFKQFAATEFSTENILFVENLDQINMILYNNNTSLNKRRPSLIPVLGELQQNKQQLPEQLSISDADIDPHIATIALAMYQKLISQFIDINGAFALNIVRSHSEMMTLMNQGIAESSIAKLYKAMLKVKDFVNANMQDTCVRFMRTEPYKQWELQQKLRTESSIALGWETNKPQPQQPTELQAVAPATNSDS